MTPPLCAKRSRWEEITQLMTLVPSFTMAAAVSSQEVSIPRMSMGVIYNIYKIVKILYNNTNALTITAAEDLGFGYPLFESFADFLASDRAQRNWCIVEFAGSTSEGVRNRAAGIRSIE